MGEPKLIRGRWVITAADEPVMENAAVIVIGDSIVGVQDWTAARARYPDAAVIGSDSSAVLPGFINAHHHGQAITSTQLGLEENILEPWLFSWAGVRDRPRYYDTLLSGARLLASGVTTTVDIWSDGGDARTYAASLGEAVRGYRESGIRACFAPGIKTQSFLVWGAGEDARFVESLPPDLRPDALRLIPDGGLAENDYFDVMADAGRAVADDPRIDLWYAFPGPQWVSDTFMQRIAERAAAAGTGVQTHVDESIYEKLHGRRAYGCDTMVHLERLGILGPRFSIAHGVWLSEAEIEVMGRTGAAVSHNPGSNLRLFAGIAPLPALREAGVTVGLGMDATTLNDDEDMFAEMRLALRLARKPFLGESAPSAADILALATLGGARLIGKADRLGRLAPGYAADIVTVNLDQVTSPWAAPECDPLSLVVLRAARRDIATVLVGGEVVINDGAPTRFNLEEAGSAFADEMARTPFPAEGAEAVQRILPHLEAWYRSWQVPPPDPYTIFNSRV